MLPVVAVVGLILVVLWASGKSDAASAAAQVSTLPPPPPIPATAGTSLLSPAMGTGSPLYSQANQVRLQTNMVTTGQGGWFGVNKAPRPNVPPPLPTAATGGQTTTAAASLPTTSKVFGGVQQANLAAYLGGRKL